MAHISIIKALAEKAFKAKNEKSPQNILHLP